MYSTLQINNNIRKMLEEGKSNDDALDFYLKMNMQNDLGPEQAFVSKAPLPAEVRMRLLEYDGIDKDDVVLELANPANPANPRNPANQANSTNPRLIVKLSPVFTLYAEKVRDSLQVTVNDKILTVMYLKYYRAEDIALWMIRQKQKLEEYMERWDAVLETAYKKAKIDHMAFLGIRAIFTEAMNEYPRIKYTVIEQKRRAKILVRIPDTDLGVIIYAWWGSYKKELPKQIESLKVLLNAHRKSTLKNFYISRRK